jgi:hypothetical protein
MLIRVRALAVIWSLWLCRNNKVCNNKNCSLLQVLYRPIFFVYGHLCSGWRIATYLRRSVHSWRQRRGILFPTFFLNNFSHMGDRIIYELNLHLLLRRSTLAQFDMYFVFFISYDTWDFRTAVCIFIMQRLSIISFLSSKSALFWKKWDNLGRWRETLKRTMACIVAILKPHHQLVALYVSTPSLPLMIKPGVTISRWHSNIFLPEPFQYEVNSAASTCVVNL